MQAGRKPTLNTSRRYMVTHPTRAFYGRCTTHTQIRFASNIVPRTNCGNMPAGIGWSKAFSLQASCFDGKHRLGEPNPPDRKNPLRSESQSGHVLFLDYLYHVTNTDIECRTDLDESLRTNVTGVYHLGHRCGTYTGNTAKIFLLKVSVNEGLP